ncbi:MAG TPA: helix-turn-helix transcriptional regulator [Stellaceae bacterium]|nr:helix-turn-helix transcriptional regulator [Stellaceae bacterium]
MLDLVGKVYDAALDERLWSSLAPRIAETFDAPSTALQLRDTRNGAVKLLGLTKNYDSSFLASYESYYAQRDVWVDRAVDVGLSTVVASKDLIEDREFERTEIYNDWCRHLDVFYLVGAVLPVTPDEIGIIGIHRPHDAATFDESDKALVAQLLPHLQRALQIRRRLSIAGVEREAAHETLDRTATATLVVARDGRILLANRKADGLFREGDAIRSLGNRLAVVGRRAGERLSDLIRGAADTASGQAGSPGGSMAIERSDRLPLTVLVAPFRPARKAAGAALPAAILFVRDPEALSPASLALQGLFGLTPAEATVAAALADGKSANEIAASLNVTLNTARTHVKNILAKTGASRQAQLVALLLRSVAVLAPK